MDELTLLREFYSRWLTFHKIERTKENRFKQEAAIERVLESHHAIEIFHRSKGDKVEELQKFRQTWNG